MSSLLLVLELLLLLMLLKLKHVLVFESFQVVESGSGVFDAMPRHVIDFSGRIARALVSLACAHSRQVLDLFADI